MKILIIGYGSIGKRHLKNMLSLGKKDTELMLCRSSKKEANAGNNVFFDLDEALAQKPDVVFITNPTSLHITAALKAAEKGCHLFIEKPLSNNADGVDKLLKIVEEKNLIVMVGYNMRFHQSIVLMKNLLDKKTIGKVLAARIEVGSYLPDWHPGEDYRKSYSASKALGGGVILDLSHELDYARWLLGEVREVMCFSGKLSSLDIETEDTAEIILRMESGALVEIHLDYLQRSPIRTCEIIGELGTIKWNSDEKDVKLFSIKKNKWESFKEKEDDRNSMYVDEVRHFIDCVENGKKPLVSALEGKKVLDIALAAKKSSETGIMIKVTDR